MWKLVSVIWSLSILSTNIYKPTAKEGNEYREGKKCVCVCVCVCTQFK